MVLIDMDCFYVQVEQQLAPETRKLPCAVVQYNNASHGGRYGRNCSSLIHIEVLIAVFLLLTTLRGIMAFQEA